MKVEKLSPVLYTKKIEESIVFYTRKLGFRCENMNVELGWALLCLDEIELMLSYPNEHIGFDKPVFTGSFYFRIVGVDEIWEKIKSEVDVCYPLQQFEYGMKEFAIYDNNGYLLQFGEEIL